MNPYKWFAEREVEHLPPHFVKCETELTDDSLLWVITKLSGRYAIIKQTDLAIFVLGSADIIYFEDPSEAMVYELRWSGSK
jgi:hypothetical protein